MLSSLTNSKQRRTGDSGAHDARLQPAVWDQPSLYCWR